MPIDFEQQDGYNGATGAPPDFADPDLRRWTTNTFHNARFGGYKRPDDVFSSIQTVHPVRGLPLLGSRQTIPGQQFTFAPPLQEFFPEYEIIYDLTGVPPSSEDPVIIHCVGNSDFRSSRHGTLFLNDVPIDWEVFGLGHGSVPNENGFHIDDVPIEISGPLNLWNLILGEGGDTMNIRFNVGTGVWQYRDVFKLSVSYIGVDERHHTFANGEICFPHRGIGFARRGDAFSEPFTAYKANNIGGYSWREVQLSVGIGWVVQDDEPADVGHPSMSVIGCPFEIPPLIESVFSAHELRCNIPVAP